MNKNSYSPGREGAGNAIIQKSLVLFLIMTLIFTSLPVHSALAAGSTSTNNYAEEWSNKLQKVRYYDIFYQRVRVYPADFENRDELAQAHDILNNYGVALRAAQRIVINHSGFNQKGKVVNDKLADQSLKDLSENLRLMRVYKERLDQLEGDYRLLPMSAIVVPASQ